MLLYGCMKMLNWLTKTRNLEIYGTVTRTLTLKTKEKERHLKFGLFEPNIVAVSSTCSRCRREKKERKKDGQADERSYPGLRPGRDRFFTGETHPKNCRQR